MFIKTIDRNYRLATFKIILEHAAWPDINCKKREGKLNKCYRHTSGYRGILGLSLQSRKAYFQQKTVKD